MSFFQREGFTVYAPPDPLRGLSFDSAYLHEFLTQNAALAGKRVVLVGHSYGGAVISDAAVGAAQVKALVYVDAFIPAPGESIGQLLVMANRAHAHITEVRAGHLSLISDPRAVAGVITRAARAAAGSVR